MERPITFFSFILLVFGCTSHDPKLAQYQVQGERLYEQHCANCHQPNGRGFGQLYPPIAGSDFLKNKDQVICLIRNGIATSIQVNGQEYSQAMPGNEKLTDLEVAELITFIYNKWGDDRLISEVNEIRTILEKCQE